MSLNGLQEPAILTEKEAVMRESGRWFLLQYATRDTIELFSTGTDGLPTLRNAIQDFQETKPLFGLLHFRRKIVVLKIVPESTSRLFLVRLTVHFSSVLDAFRPYDSVLSVESASEITDSALSSPTLKSRATSMDWQPLNKIAEDEAEGEKDHGRPDANDSSTQASTRASLNMTEEEFKSSADASTLASIDSGAPKPQHQQPLSCQHPSSSSLSVKSAMPDFSRRKFSIWNSLYTKYREHGQKQQDSAGSSLRSTTPETDRRPSTSRLSIISSPERWRSISRRSISSRSSHAERAPTPNFDVYMKPHARPHVDDTHKSSLTPRLLVDVAASRPKTAYDESSRNGGRSVSLPFGLRARTKYSAGHVKPDSSYPSSADATSMTRMAHGNNNRNNIEKGNNKGAATAHATTGDGGGGDRKNGHEPFDAPSLPPLPVADLLIRHKKSKVPPPPNFNPPQTACLTNPSPNGNASTINDNDNYNGPTIQIHCPPSDTPDTSAEPEKH